MAGVAQGLAQLQRDPRREGERRLKPLVLAPLGRSLGLQEGRERLQLGRKQEGDIEYAGALGEALADAFLLGEGVSHGNSVRVESDVGPEQTGKRKSAPRVISDRKSRFAFAGWRVLK